MVDQSKLRKMELNNTDLSIRKVALIAGVAVFINAVVAGIANFVVLQNLFVSGDATTTANNILASLSQFQLGIVAFVFVCILDTIIAWGLYIVLRPVNKSLSLFTAWLGIMAPTVLLASLTNLVNTSQLLNGASYLNAFSADQVNAQVMANINSFNNGFSISLLIFGVHLVVVGYLFFISNIVFKSRYVTRVVGILLIVAGLGYTIDTLGKFLIANYTVTIASFTFIGELLLGFWLVWKGINGFDDVPTKQEVD